MGFCVCSMCCTLLCVLSSFAFILMGKIERWLLIFVRLLGVIVIGLALPHGAVGWSAVCDCGISCIILSCFFQTSTFAEFVSMGI